MEDVQTDKWPFTDVTQFECPRRTISDPVMESGSCNWCYNNNKKSPNHAAAPGGVTEGCAASCHAGLQKNVSVARQCLYDWRAASSIVCGPGSPSQAHSFPSPSVYCKKWQNKAPVFRFVCRVNSLYFPPLQKKKYLVTISLGNPHS